MTTATGDNVTLHNCADEPIHLPGAIQPHGALLALEAERLVGWSANVAALTGAAARPHAGLAELGLADEVLEAIRTLLADLREEPEIAAAGQVLLGGAAFDMVAHRHDGRDLVEFERRSNPQPAAQHGRAYARIKRAANRNQLLEIAVQEVRRWTGFDRVMAYVFRHDDSGEVVAEDRSPQVDSFLGMRFPASDIPAQARRLYTLNTLRLIADIAYTPVPLLGTDGRPLDLSHAVLRSVSPIHVEYLRNMGVQASMSVSIVIEGRLWGLIACHHYGVLQVPYAVRQACDILAQLVASGLQTQQARTTADRLAEGTQVLRALASASLLADQTVDVLSRFQRDLLALLRAEALVFTHQGRVLTAGPLGQDEARSIAAHFHALKPDLVKFDDRGDWPEALQQSIGPWVGALGIRYDAAADAWLIALRREQLSTVRWAGRPDKVVVQGPNGDRLTPRGSFQEWQETVRGKSLPWAEVTHRLLRQLQLELRSITDVRHAEVEAARQNLLAVLGHDLRDPLHAMSMLAGVLKAKGSEGRIGDRLASTTGRMQSMVSHVLDFSRAEAGQELVTQRKRIDLATAVDDVLEECRLGHPGVPVHADLQRGVYVEGDAVRLVQAIGNLVSNARQHGGLGQEIGVRLTADAGEARVEITNPAPEIPADIVKDLFSAYKRRTDSTTVNRSGLGLGLYIAARIAAEHSGALAYAHQDGRVVFTLTLPVLGLAGVAASGTT